MSTSRTLIEQVQDAHRQLGRTAYYGAGMAVFVTPYGLKWTAQASREYPKLMLRYGDRALAGIYTRGCPLEWMEADVAQVAEPCD